MNILSRCEDEYMASPEKPDPKWRRFEKIIHNMHTQLAPQALWSHRTTK